MSQLGGIWGVAKVGDSRDGEVPRSDLKYLRRDEKFCVQILTLTCHLTQKT
jgi:hypothetical protein